MKVTKSNKPEILRCTNRMLEPGLERMARTTFQPAWFLSNIAKRTASKNVSLREALGHYIAFAPMASYHDLVLFDLDALLSG